VSVFEQFMHLYAGFETDRSEIVDMPVEMLYKEALAEAPYRGEEDTEEAKDILYGVDSFERSKRLQKLYDEWDIVKCEPLDIKCEGTFLMINNGFHRIAVARMKGLASLQVNMQYGHFILSRHISIYDLRDLIKMLKIMFREYPTVDSLDKFLSDDSFDENRMRHSFIGFGYLGGIKNEK
jgi:hypothetical protein